MGDATETLQRMERRSAAVAGEGRSSTQAPPVVEGEGATVSAIGLARARRDEQWCSTLDSKDLSCLLRVIESQLLPQLIDSYSPAGGLPHR